MTLNDQITQKAKQTRQEAETFESSLASQFREVKNKSSDNVDKIKDQLDLLIEQAEIENNIANEVSIISALFSKNALLEDLVYAKIEEKLSVFPKKDEEVEVKSPTVTPAPETPKPKEKKKPRFSIPFLSSRKPSNKPPQSLASGGISPGNSKQKQEENQKLSAPYADVMKVSLQASGIASLSVLGNFISGTGALGGFFMPYLKSMVRPFVESLGVSQTILNSLLGGSVQAATLDLKDKQKYFSKTWGKFLNDAIFVDKFIDKESTDLSDPDAPAGYVPSEWKEDPEFVALVNNFAREWNLNANGLLALMASESGIKPSSINKYGCVGLIQFCPGGGLEGTGKTAQELSKMTRSQQWPYVINYWIKSGLEKGMTAGDIYGLTHVPNWYKSAVKGKPVGSVARMEAVVATSADGAAYSENARLDFNNDGKITVRDYDNEVKRVGKSFKINYATGGDFKTSRVIQPSIIFGPQTGYSVSLDGKKTAFIGDGVEIVESYRSGVKIYPVITPAFNAETDIKKTFTRWAQIAFDDNSLDLKLALKSAMKLNTPTNQIKKSKTVVNFVPGKNTSPAVIPTEDSNSFPETRVIFNPHNFTEESLLTRLR